MNLLKPIYALHNQVGLRSFLSTDEEAELVRLAVVNFGYLLRTVCLTEYSFGEVADLIEAANCSPQAGEIVATLRKLEREKFSSSLPPTTPQAAPSITPGGLNHVTDNLVHTLSLAGFEEVSSRLGVDVRQVIGSLRLMAEALSETKSSYPLDAGPIMVSLDSDGELVNADVDDDTLVYLLSLYPVVPAVDRAGEHYELMLDMDGESIIVERGQKDRDAYLHCPDLVKHGSPAYWSGTEWVERSSAKRYAGVERQAFKVPAELTGRPLVWVAVDDIRTRHDVGIVAGDVSQRFC